MRLRATKFRSDSNMLWKIEKKKQRKFDSKQTRARRASIRHDIIDPARIAEREILLFLECSLFLSLSLSAYILVSRCTWLQFVFEFGIPGPAQRRYVYLVLVINSSTAHASSYVRGQLLFTRFIKRARLGVNID